MDRVAGGVGALAADQTPSALMRRILFTTFLFEDVAYQNGAAIAWQMANLIPDISPEECADMVRMAAHVYKLRRVPLWMIVHMLRHSEHRKLVRRLIVEVITRPDQLCDIIVLYQTVNGKQAPLANALKKGIADTLRRFDRYQLAKYMNKRTLVTLADVVKLTHPKPPVDDPERYRALIERNLPAPDTWEVALSRKEDKYQAFIRLMASGKLPVMAAIRNINGMLRIGIKPDDIIAYLKAQPVDRLNPTVILAALLKVKHDDICHVLEQYLRRDHIRFQGTTVVILDVSGSMLTNLTRYSTLNRLTIASYIAYMIAQHTDRCILYATAGSDMRQQHKTVELTNNVSSFLSFYDVVDDIQRSLGSGGIFTAQAVDYVHTDLIRKQYEPDRLIVITDSQDMDVKSPTPRVFAKFNAIVDIGGHTRGVAYGGVWDIEITGWSPVIIDALWMAEQDHNQ